MPVFLVPVDGSAAVPIDKAIVFFGRHNDCDISLVQSRKVSRKHCLVAVIDDHFVIRDLGSMNGVRVNGMEVKKEAKFNLGDEVTIGDVVYRLQAVEAPKKGPNLGPTAASAANGGAVSGKPKAPLASAAKSPLVRQDPRFMSLDIPVVVDDPGGELVFEETLDKMTKSNKPSKSSKKPPQVFDEEIEINEDDLIEDDD